MVQTAFLGDVVLTTPLLTHLSRGYATVDVVCAPASHDLLETHPAVANAIVFDKRGRDRGLGGIRHLTRTLRALRYDVAFLPHRSLRSALLAGSAGIPRRIGFADSRWRWLYTDTREATAPHETARNLALADCHEPIAPSLHLTPRDRSAAARCLAQAGVSAGDRFAVLAPGAAWATKRWPHYPALARLLRPRIKLVSIGTEADRGLLGEAVGVVDLAGRLTIRESAAIIEAAVVAVTNDSAPLHIAGALGTPVLAVFGPTAADRGFGPTGARDRVAEHGSLACRPCSTHGGRTCPQRHHRCLLDLTAEQVGAIANEMIAAILGED